jgi:hypothetical protein
MSDDIKKENSRRGIFSGAIVLVAVASVLFVVAPILKSTVLNNLNRIYDEYDLITSISTNYIEEEITITTGSTSWFDVFDNTNTYSLQQVYDSPLFDLDNSVTAPTMVEGIVHIPDTYPR